MERRAGGYRREKHDVRNGESLGSYILRLLVTLVPHLQHASPLHDPLVTSLRSSSSFHPPTSHLTPSPPVPFPSGEARPLRGEEGTGREKGTEGGMEVGTRKPTHFQGWLYL